MNISNVYQMKSRIFHFAFSTNKKFHVKRP